MATQSAGTIIIAATPKVIWEDEKGAAAVMLINGSGTPGDNLYVRVDGLHASGEWIPLAPLGYGSQLVSHVIFTIRPRGIKKIWAYRPAASAAAYYQTMET